MKHHRALFHSFFLCGSVFSVSSVRAFILAWEMAQDVTACHRIAQFCTRTRNRRNEPTAGPAMTLTPSREGFMIPPLYVSDTPILAASGGRTIGRHRRLATDPPRPSRLRPFT